MKSVFAFILLVTFSVGAHATTSKVCFWVSGTYGSKGERMFATINTKAVVLESTTGDAWQGTYPRVTPSVQGRDGVLYYVYDAGYDDGNNKILVDANLLKVGTKGLIKMRSRGESYFEEKYFCRDAK